jgi:chorismate mutase
MSIAAAPDIREVPDPKETPKESPKRSKSRLRELAAEVDKLQDQLADLDTERAGVKKAIAAAIKAWNDEASKRK